MPDRVDFRVDPFLAISLGKIMYDSTSARAVDVHTTTDSLPLSGVGLGEHIDEDDLSIVNPQRDQ
jgi:hypothetical protein